MCYDTERDALRPLPPIYTEAFDRCAAALPDDREVVVVTNASLYAGEMLRRLPGRAAVYSESEYPVGMPGHILWLMPSRSSWLSYSELWMHAARPGTCLVILGYSGRWRRLLLNGSAPPLPLRIVVAGLTVRGWRICTMLGFQQITSIVIGMTARLPALLGRDDLVDRWHAAARERFTISGRRAGWAPLWLIAAERLESN